MSRIAVALIVLTLFGIAAGCRICATPYDHCSPTFTGQPGEPYSPTARAGSILAGNVTPVPYAESVPAPVPENDSVMQQFLQDEEIASGVVLSVTDRKVEPTAEPQPQPQLQPQPQSQPQMAERPRVASSQGWTAAKPKGTRTQ
jgi:hypothetical protein